MPPALPRNGAQFRLLSWVYRGAERGALGALEEGRRPEVDRARLWQAVFLHFCTYQAQRRDHAAGPATIPAGADTGGARGDLSRPCGGPIGSLDGACAGPLALDGQPRDWPQWRVPAATAPAAADKRAWKQALRPKPCKLAVHGHLRQAVAAKLEKDWSPEQIAGWLKRTYPDTEARRVSHETIYRSLYVQARGVLKKELMQHLAVPAANDPPLAARHAESRSARPHPEMPSPSASDRRRSRTGPCLATGKATCSADRRTATSSPWSNDTRVM